MHASPRLYVLSVGHGSCYILIDHMTVIVIDCGPDGSILIMALRYLKITVVDHIIISHADSDHIGGLADLLRAFPVRNIHMNPDASKIGEKQQGILRALKLADRAGTRIYTQLTCSSPTIVCGEVNIEILAPSAILAASGPGGISPEGRALDSNDLSVVISLVHQGCRVALLPGDLSEFGLDQLLEQQMKIEAKILVFPHHGGSAGGKDDRAFAQRLTSLVQPELVLFSLHRNLHNLPKESIIAGVRAARPKAHLMCTQLSRKCCPHLFPVSFSYLSDLPAKGFEENSCCGGSICIHLNGELTTYEPDCRAHQQFVREVQIMAKGKGHPSPLCLLDSPSLQVISQT